MFVTIGNATQGFSRLLGAVDRLAGQGYFAGDPVLVQSGSNSNFPTAHCIQIPFLSMEGFLAKIIEADLVITHAGAGTLLHVLLAGKVPVVMPRRRKYGELIDDHQLELVEVLAVEGRIIPALEPADLPSAIARARRQLQYGKANPSSCLVSLVGKAIDDLIERAK